MKDQEVHSNYYQLNAIETAQHQEQNPLKKLINKAMPRDQPNL